MNDAIDRTEGHCGTDISRFRDFERTEKHLMCELPEKLKVDFNSKCFSYRLDK